MDTWQVEANKRDLARQAHAAEFEDERLAAAKDKEEERERDAQWFVEFRAKNKARLEAENAVGRAAQAEREEVRLAPQKAIEEHRWLAAHPANTPADFERAWVHIRATVLEAEREQAAVNARAHYASIF